MGDRNISSKNYHVLSFEDLNFSVRDGGNYRCCGDRKEKKIIDGIYGTARSGQMISVLGPSGAGKTTLLNILSLRATYGKNDGRLLLDGVRLDSSIFKARCFLVGQHDRNWECLTVEETCTFAARLFGSGSGDRRSESKGEDVAQIVENILDEVGLTEVARSRNSKLSGGQQRRLSLAIALLKEPAVLFLDEVTSGLDSASADNVCKAMRRIVDEENIMIICTIHQPSTKIFLECFDRLMLLSNGRTAYSGETKDSPSYFEKLGYPVPPMTNPAEHYLELVNSDFGCPDTVKNVLDSWENRCYKNREHELIDLEGRCSSTERVVSAKDWKPRKHIVFREIGIVFKRQFLLTCRDPILYVGRCIAVLGVNSVFGLVYYSARKYVQEQALSKCWVAAWYVAVASMLGAVAVYFLNGEVSAILSEQRNGMLGTSSYVIAKTVISLPFVFIYALFALGIPGYIIQDFQLSATSTWKVFLCWSCCLYVFEAVAESAAVWFENVVLGVLVYLCYWIGSFLFNGLLLSYEDLPPFLKPIYHVMPLSYYARSSYYALYGDVAFEPCDRSENPFQPICVETGSGSKVIEAVNGIFPVVENEDTFYRDMLILCAQLLFFKILFLFGIYCRGTEVSIPNPKNLSSKHSTVEEPSIALSSRRSSSRMTMSIRKVTNLDESDDE